ncbi:hypothetical protein HMPREF9418_1648 [Neisseria macacae ATCC 33926]|uniref:Uncharacterized protein n=1 Tax=Neisseria macacae ATCC 33926 TaxID=997348 RepID=A0AA36XKC5_9NEIS|nr:hypothetical protein HMPREF9418_1648 [Neisseria macacae ATCC 33926]
MFLLRPLKLKGRFFCPQLNIASIKPIKKGRLKSDSNFKSGFRRPFVYCRLLACFR